MGKNKGDVQHRHTIAQQARALLTGQDEWVPSWTQMPNDLKVMRGFTDPPKQPEKKLPLEKKSPKDNKLKSLRKRKTAILEPSKASLRAVGDLPVRETGMEGMDNRRESRV
jgi:hypothetical protein